MTVIGVTTYVDTISWGDWTREAVFLPSSYIKHVRSAGFTPVVLPPLPEAPADELMARCDALILAGGPDLDPAHYGAAPHSATGAPHVERDTWELQLLEAAIAARRPVLGICRGMQLINVHFGGTLCQHLPDVVGHDEHLAAPGTFGRHDITLDQGSLLGASLGGTLSVPTYHHQGIGLLGRDVEAVAHAADGTVEAIRVLDHHQIWGVQWHPEESTDTRLVRGLLNSHSKVVA
ncbi:MAG: gamma-glutamyl-gamma-aminobutyrate hydrolase family protein [Nocardioidaceae bacterium]